MNTIKYFFSFLLLIHSALHFLGFIKAFRIAEISQLSQIISKPMGLLWLLTALLFAILFVLSIANTTWWFYLAFLVILISQTLIINFWKEAKLGTFPNVVILIMAIISLAHFNFENNYKKDVFKAIKTSSYVEEIITQKDIDSLP
jgi:hypothetical protein